VYTGLVVRVQFLAVTINDDGDVERESIIEKCETDISGGNYEHERAASLYSRLEERVEAEAKYE
jgi:hypothetical protein